MTENKNSLPAYAGDEPYVFVSYAHKNSGRVLAVVDELVRRGYRVWYDEGIMPGEAWDNSIADRLKGCRCFLGFLSKEYLESTNCRDELNMARNTRRNMALVYLEDITLTPGMQMRYNRLQALFLHKTEPEDFYRKLAEMDGMADAKAVKNGG